MAMGLTKIQEMETSKSMTEKARSDAAAIANAASQQAATGAAPTGKEVKPAPKVTGYEKLAEISVKRRSAY